MMLETLTKEQGALNGQTVHSAASDQQKNSSGEVNQVQLRQPASTTVEPKLAVEEPELNSTELAQAPIEEPEPSSTELAQTPIEEPELNSTELAQAPIEEPEPSSTELAQTPIEEPELNSTELAQAPIEEPEPSSTELAQTPIEEPELSSTELAQAPIEEPEPSSTELAQTPIEEPEPSSTELAQAPNEESGSALQELLEISSQSEDLVIEESNPQESVAPETHEERAAQNLTNESINDLEMDDLTSLATPEKETSLQLSLESSEFANFGSEVESQDHSGADALALLQDQPVEVDSAPQENRNSRALVNKNRIDGDLLDELTDTDEDQGALNKVFVRREKMKPYRRDHAKYCCSACSKEFFTQEQVEACFFSHPEEGSEEERLLLEKVAKLSNNTAA